MYCYKYPRPALTTDVVLFAINQQNLEVLLIQRKNAPFKNMFALPGGFVDMDETVEQCAARELEEETALSNVPLIQMHTFSAPERDPRGRTVSVVFFSLISQKSLKPVAGDDAKAVKWFDLEKLPELAFDHKQIIEHAARFALTNLKCISTNEEFSQFIDFLTDKELSSTITVLQKFLQNEQ